MSNIQMQFNKKSNHSSNPPPRSHTSMEMQAQRDLRMPSMPSAHSRDAHNREAHNRDSANFARTYEKFYHDQQRATHDDHTCYVPLARSTLRPRTSLISRAFGESAPDIQVAAAMGAVATYMPNVPVPHPSHYMQEQPTRNGGGYSQSCPLQQYVADRATHTSRHVGQRQRAIQNAKQSVISLLPDTVLSVRAKNNTFMGTMLRASPVLGVGLVPASSSSFPQATMYQNHSIGRRSRSRVEL